MISAIARRGEMLREGVEAIAKGKGKNIGEKTEIITLCGSTRFMEEFREVERKLTLEGKIVLTMGVYGCEEDVEFSPEIIERLNNLQLRKIDMSTGVYVIDVNGHIEESTRKEIDYALRKGKEVRYYSREVAEGSGEGKL